MSKFKFYLRRIIIIAVFGFIAYIAFRGSDIQLPEPAETKSGLSVHFIDVGQGDALLISQGDAHMLIDGGPETARDDLLAYLSGRKIQDFDYIVATHPHEDHIGGLPSVLGRYDAEEFIMSGETTNTRTYELLLDAIDRQGLRVTLPKVGATYRLGEAEFTIVGPSGGDYQELNDYSVCVRLEYGDTSFLFTGDAESIPEREMVKSQLPLHSDVFKAGHHGGATSNTEDFLKGVSPDHAVISVGEGNSYGHPNPEAIRRIEDAGARIYRTDQMGTIIASSDGKTVRVQAASPVSALGEEILRGNWQEALNQGWEDLTTWAGNGLEDFWAGLWSNIEKIPGEFQRFLENIFQ